MFPEGKDEISRLSVSHSDIFSAETNYNSFKFILTESVWLNLLYFWFSILCLPRAIFVNIINGSNAIHYLLWNKMFIICSIFRTPLAYFLHHTLRLSLNILWSLRRWSLHSSLVWAMNDSVQHIFIEHRLYTGWL